MFRSSSVRLLDPKFYVRSMDAVSALYRHPTMKAALRLEKEVHPWARFRRGVSRNSKSQETTSYLYTPISATTCVIL
jgi:hypothetical protein